jgi:hypothetical protein
MTSPATILLGEVKREGAIRSLDAGEGILFEKPLGLRVPQKKKAGQRLCLQLCWGHGNDTYGTYGTYGSGATGEPARDRGGRAGAGQVQGRIAGGAGALPV